MTEALLNQREVSEQEDAERREQFPLGAALTLDDMAVAGREGVLDELRTNEPVSWVPALGGWLVTSREGVRRVLAPSSGATVESQQNMVRASLGRMMLTVDGDEQERMRTPLEWAFRGPAIRERFEADIVSLVDDLIDSFVAAGEVELDAAFAAPFAVRMSGQSLGLSLADVERMDGFYSAFAGAMEYHGDLEPVRRADEARDQLNAILLAELERNRSEPNHSLTAVLAADGQSLTEDEIVAQLRVVMFGGIETIQASVLSTLYLLLQHPEQFAAVQQDRALLGNASEEARRLIPPVTFMERWTRAPLTVQGVTIPAHEFVGMSVLAANRDPATFDNPLTFDIHRANSARGLSFSYGTHTCLGIHLARLQTDIAVSRLIDRLPALTLISAEPAAGFAFRRPAHVRIRWNS